MMAQFIGKMTSSRGNDVTRLGHKTSGLDVSLNGWNAGVRVLARYDEEFKDDVFTLIQTSGSNGNGVAVELGHIIKGNFIPSAFLKLANA